MWTLVLLEVLTRLLSLFPSSSLSTYLLPVLLPSSDSSSAVPTLLTPLPSTSYIALFALFAGTVLRHTCFSALGRHFSFTHTTLAEHTLISSGPYAYARHPSYTGEVAVRGGAAALLIRAGGYAARSGALGFGSSFDWGVGVNSLSSAFTSLDAHTLVLTLARLALLIHLGWNAYAVPYLLFRAPREDAALRTRFGAQWDIYAARVPYRFIPGLL